MMKKNYIILLLCVVSLDFTAAQTTYPDIYPVTSGEFIFCGGDVDISGVDQEMKMRFSFFFHYGQYWHIDLNNHFGFFTGGAIRNIGLKTANETYSGYNNKFDKIVRRSYALGVPLALKLGSFDDHLFVYGGGEYEWMFHYKQKFFDDKKHKTSEWFSDRTNPFIPSVFVGIQFPKGLNLRFKYYLDDFLNRDFQGNDFGNQVDYSGYKTQMFYVSVSFDFKTKDIIKKAQEPVLASR